MSRLHPIPCGTGIALVPDWMAPPTPHRDERIVRPARRKARRV